MFLYRVQILNITAGFRMQQDQRAFTRYDACLKVVTKEAGKEQFLQTANVSRSGAFVYTEHPRPLGFLVKLAFELPDQSVVSVMAKVARSILPEESEQCGMGVAFFCLDKDHKHCWDSYILGLRAPKAPVVPLSLETPLPEHTVDRTSTDESESSDEDHSQKPAGSRSHKRHVTSFLVRLKDRERLHQFFTEDISAGGMFLKTPLLKREGEEVELILVHPETEDEFRMSGFVRRVVKGSIRERGMGIEFAPLSKKTLKALHEFILTGINFLDASCEMDEEEELLFSPAQWRQVV